MRRWGWSAFASLLLALAAVPAGAGAAQQEPAAAVTDYDSSTDMAKMYRVPHRLTVKAGEREAVLDGEDVLVEPVLTRGGRTYFALRMAEQAGAGTAAWDAERREAVITMKETVRGPWRTLAFRPGDPKLYREDGSVIEDASIPAPFVANGRVYVPVVALQWLGISASWREGALDWYWSDKMIEVLQPRAATPWDKISFTVLYEADMHAPGILAPSGEGGWTQAADRVWLEQRNIELEGRMYNRIAFTLPLEPGANRFLLSAVGAGDAEFEVVRVKS